MRNDSLIFNFTCLQEVKYTPCISGVCIKISQSIPSRKSTDNLPEGEVFRGFVAISKSQKPSSINGNLKLMVQISQRPETVAAWVSLTTDGLGQNGMQLYTFSLCSFSRVVAFYFPKYSRTGHELLLLIIQLIFFCWYSRSEGQFLHQFHRKGEIPGTLRQSPLK